MIIGSEDSMQSVVGGPFVIISKVPIEDPYNINNGRNEDDDLRADQFILLKTEDGTLLSFRESWADNLGGSNTGVTIELFDPDHLFLLQFIDNNAVKGFEVMVRSKAGAEAFGEAYEKVGELTGEKERLEGELKRAKSRANIPTLSDIPVLNSLQEDQSSFITYVQDYLLDTAQDQIQEDFDDTIATTQSQLDDATTALSDLKENIYHTNNNFYITYGNGKDNLASSRSFSFAKLDFIHDAEKQGGLRLEFVHNESQSRAAELKREQAKDKGYLKDEQKIYSGDALIAELEFTDNEPGKFVVNDTADIVNLMEITLQNFIREDSTSDHIPLVFLSSEVLPRMLSIGDDARDQNPVQKMKLERTVTSNYTLLLNAKSMSFLKLLVNFGFSINESPLTLADPFQSTKRSISYRLRILKDKYKNSTEQVNDIIKKIYDKLGIVTGNEICNINMNNPEHAKYFLKEFLQKNDHDLITKDGGFSYNNVRKVDFSKTTPSVHLIGDGFFIQGVMYKLPYEENEAVHSLYSNAQEGSNIYRFLKINYPSYLKVIRRIYVDPVRKAGRFLLPDEYASKQHDVIFNKLTESVPSFISNMEHSNVISFVGTHSRKEQTELASNLPLAFSHTFFKTLKDGDAVKRLKSKDVISEEQKEKLLKDMIDFEYENSSSMGTLIKHIKSGFTAKNSDTAESYKKVLDAFLINLEASDLYKDNNVSIHAVRTYLLYMQKLAFGISKVKAKTTPMFYLMPEFWINKPCLFLNKKLHSPNSTFFINREGTFSGIYTMLGFEHVISGSECYSSFNLIRVPIPTGELDNASPGK